MSIICANLKKLHHFFPIGSRTFFACWLLTLGLIFINKQANSNDHDPHLYVTGSVMEIDRCASAWLIKRHVDKEATFLFLSDEELIESKGIQFDTPFAKLRRTHRSSTFEAIKDKFLIENKNVELVSALIHDIEINFWDKKVKKETAKFEHELKQLINSSERNMVALEGCFNYLDDMIGTNQHK